MPKNHTKKNLFRSTACAVICLLMLTGLLAGCAAGQTTTTTTMPTTTATTSEMTTTAKPEPQVVRIAALKGPTGMGLAELMQKQESGAHKNKYEVSLYSAPDDIVALLSSKQVDVAAVPTNLAAILYQKLNQQVKLLAINTLGVLYILENGDTVHSLADLSGKQIVTSGQGAVPEYVLNELLAKSNLAEPATIVFKTEHAEVLTLAASGQADLVMLPEPFVTTLLSKNSSFRIALDLTAEWKKIQSAGSTASELSMGCMVVTDGFAQEHPQVLSDFLADYKDSVDFVNGYPEDAGELIAKFGIMPDAALAAKAIPNSHIVLIQGEAMQPVLQPFLEILLASNPASVGGKLPDQAFYWMP